MLQNGDLCISILHPPIDDPQSGELPCERWNPTQNVRTILLSVISLLNEPNTFSPANVDASVMYRRWKESNGKDNEYPNIVRWVAVFVLIIPVFGGKGLFTPSLPRGKCLWYRFFIPFVPLHKISSIIYFIVHVEYNDIKMSLIKFKIPQNHKSWNGIWNCWVSESFAKLYKFKLLFFNSGWTSECVWMMSSIFAFSSAYYKTYQWKHFIEDLTDKSQVYQAK